MVDIISGVLLKCSNCDSYSVKIDFIVGYIINILTLFVDNSLWAVRFPK